MLPLRFLTAAALTALLLSPLTTALVPAAALDAPGLAETTATLQAAQALGDGFAPGTAFGDLLARAATRDPAAQAASGPAAGSFEQAVAALYAAAGQPMGAVNTPPEPLASALAPVIAATAYAGAETNAAFGDLTAEERAFLLAHITDLLPASLPEHTPAAAADAARAAQLAQRVDVQRMTDAAEVLAQAMDAFGDTFDPEGAGYGADSTGTCIDSGCMIEVGNTGGDLFDVPRVLIIDLGGNDQYKGAMGVSAPGIPLALPVSAILDLGGNDVYTSTTVAPGQPSMNWAQGVGVGGIGLVLDVQGNDAYDARLINSVVPASCPYDYSTFHTAQQFIMAQGVGVLGVGAVLDGTGDDSFTVVNTWFGNQPCHWGKVYSWTQGTGLHFGLGLLANGDGRDSYYTHSAAAYVDDNLAITTAQGAGAGGIGVLADANGADSYVASSAAYLGSYVYRNKGAFAWTFAQGSVLTTGYDPSSGQFQPIAPKLGTGVAPPAAVRSVNLCATLAQAPLCDSAGVGLLIDAQGADRFAASANASEPQGCGWTSTAVVSAQGSAAWSGLAALVNLEAGGRDSFSLTSTGTGGGCFVLGARAHTYGQGYGGSIHWLFWEFTAPDSVLLSAPVAYASANPLWTPAVGLLVSAADLNANGGIPALPTLALSNLLGSLGGVGEVYVANAYANNFWSYGCQGQCPLAVAEVWVQGAAGNLAQTSYWPMAPGFIRGDTAVSSSLGMQKAGTGVGVGVHLDAMGADAFVAQSDARSTGGPANAQARTVAQGAAVKGIALLANLGGADSYRATSLRNLANVPAMTQAQAYAEGSFTGVQGCVLSACAPAAVGSFPAVGLQLDLGGTDVYSEASEPASGACQGDQRTWGTLLGCVTISPAYTGRGLGVDDLSTL